MPTYEYECTQCGEVVELFQPITEAARKKLKKDDPKPCDCDAPVRRRIGTGAGIIFKGSGFYQTDYRSEGYKKAAEKDKESGSDKKESTKESTKDSGSKTTSSGDGDKKSSGTSKKDAN